MTRTTLRNLRLWDELTEDERHQVRVALRREHLTEEQFRDALWERTDGGWDRFPLHPSDAARFKMTARKGR